MRGIRRPARAVGAAARRAGLALAYLLLAFAVLCGIARSGARYFYCEAFGLTTSDPCARASLSEDAAPRGNAVDEPVPDCCEVLTLPSVPEGARTANPSVSPAAQVAALPAPSLETVPANVTLPSRTSFDRWRPPPRSSSEVCAQLMVFLS